MKEKALFSILLMSTCVSTIFMLFILKGIDSVRDRTATIGPGGFNSLILLDHGMDIYATALEQYRANIGDQDKQQLWAKEYQANFEILWGNLSHFNLRLLDVGAPESKLLNFKHDAEQFLHKTESAMTTNQTLDANQVAIVLDDLEVLRDQIHVLGQEYFYNYLLHRDSWVKELSNLYNLLLFFSAMLVTAAGLLIAFLIRSNHKKNMLIRAADEARSKLSSTVEELRSGRLEQRAKDSFIAAASHDLRQPLHALGLFLGSLKTHIDDEKGRSTLNEAIECSTNLGSLFNSLLDLSRLDAGIVEVEHQHFRLQNFVAMLQNEYQAKTCELDARVQMQVQDVVVKSDPILLSRIVRNLVENALIHSRADTITVKCTIKGSVVQLIVQDNGVGISLAEQERVFNEYYQINNRSSGTGKGLGLGLSIVKRLAILLEMPITLHSEVGVCTRFTMDICKGVESEIVDSHLAFNTMPKNVHDTQGTIAVIDDDENICVAMTSMLQSIGLRTITATTADELIDNIIESNTLPSMIVADYRLQKGKTGDQAIVQLRRALNIDIPGLLITADTAPNHVSEAVRSGFEVLHKPVQPAELSDKIRKMLEQQREESTHNEPEPAIKLAN